MYLIRWLLFLVYTSTHRAGGSHLMRTTSVLSGLYLSEQFFILGKRLSRTVIASGLQLSVPFPVSGRVVQYDEAAAAELVPRGWSLQPHLTTHSAHGRLEERSFLLTVIL